MNYKRACVHCNTVIDRKSVFCPCCGQGQPFVRESKQETIGPRRKLRTQRRFSVTKRRKTRSN